MTDYKLLVSQLEAITEGIPHKISNLANASALIYDALEDINWAGFYFYEGDILVLGPFQGKVACIELHNMKGVCGTAAYEDKTYVVDNVHDFPGHVACDSASNSEIVVPIHRDGKVIGVLDIDSPVFNRFTEEDRIGLENFVKALEKADI